MDQKITFVVPQGMDVTITVAPTNRYGRASTAERREPQIDPWTAAIFSEATPREDLDVLLKYSPNARVVEKLYAEEPGRDVTGTAILSSS